MPWLERHHLVVVQCEAAAGYAAAVVVGNRIQTLAVDVHFEQLGSSFDTCWAESPE